MPTNKEIIANLFAETAKSNGRPFVDAMAEDATWRAIGSGSWSGVFHGKESILKDIFGVLRGRLTGPTTTIPTRILADGDFVVVQANGRNTTIDGKAYNNDYCFVIRMAAGKIVEVTEYLDTELATSALGPRTTST
jgi:hypothetical protein